MTNRLVVKVASYDGVSLKVTQPFNIGHSTANVCLFNLGFIRPDHLVSHGLRVFRCLLANSKRAVMCLLLRSGFRLATLPYRPDWWSAAEMVVLLEGSPLSTEQRWSTVRVTIGFLVTSLTKALLPRLVSLAGRLALGNVLVANFFHLRMMEATVFLGTFNAA